MRYLTFALAKGRLANRTLEILEQIGYTCEEMKDPKSRKLIFTNEDQKIKIFLSKANDVPTYVEYGAADIGVVGKDTILEEGRKLYEVIDLGIGKCRMCVAGPVKAKELLENGGLIRVATKYPNIAKNYFYNKKHQTVEIIKLNGSIELAPIVGLSEVIVDIVETGSTLRENGLEVLEEIYQDNGYYREKLISIVLEGVEGSKRIRRMMQHFRENPLNSIDDMILEKTVDYLYDETGNAKSNVLKYYYIDEEGALTYADSGCINNFKLEKAFKALFNERLVQLFKIFENENPKAAKEYISQLDDFKKSLVNLDDPVVYRNTSNVTLYCRADFSGNVLMVLNKDTSQKDNIYKLFKMYSWYLNLDTTNYKVTSNISINNNYTKYPRVQKSRQNYMAISLQSLMGYMSCTNIEVIDTQELIDDIRNLINTNLVMLLKTTKGAILKVTPSSDISFNINEIISLTSLSLDLVEIGDAKDISVINKESNPVWDL